METGTKEMVVRTIRQLLPVELPSLLEMAHKFYEDSGLPGVFNDEVFIRAWTGFITGGTGAIFVVLEKNKVLGGLGGLTYKDICTGSGRSLEAFWYVDEKSRHTGVGSQLLYEFEQWSRSHGCTVMVMGAIMMPGFTDLEKFYVGEGFKVSEVNFSKELT